MRLWNNLGKYPVQNRATGEIFETPQVAYMMIAATLFAKYPKETRMDTLKDIMMLSHVLKFLCLRQLWQE